MPFVMVSGVGGGMGVSDGVIVLQGEGGFGWGSQSFSPFVAMAHCQVEMYEKSTVFLYGQDIVGNVLL